MHFSTVATLAAYAATAAAYSPKDRTFAVNHFYGKGPLVMGRMDPIVNPGGPASHVHAVQGGNAFALNMTDTQALSSTCTSSRVKNDKSNYWTPSLYFVDPKTGSIESVPMFYMNVYYFFEATTDKIKAFKPGHRMVVGNPSLRTPPPSGGRNILDLDDSHGPIQPVQFTCPRLKASENAAPLYPPNSDGLHGVGIQDDTNKGAGAGFPDQNCDQYASPLRADVHFPSCWNPAEGLDNYKTNMAWPTKGNCPTGYVHVPHLFYEVYWNTPLFKDRWTPGQGKQPFVLSNGDPTGYGLHGDFISGWDETTLQQIIDNCNAGDVGMETCPGLIGGVNNPATTCNIESAIQETILGVLPALPGNNPIGKWGVPLVQPGTSSSSTKVAVALPVPTGIKDVAPSSATHTTTTSEKATEAHSTTVVEPNTVAPVVAPAQTLITAYVTTTATQYTTISSAHPAPTNKNLNPTAPSSINITLPANWIYIGCYSDIRQHRVLNNIEFANLGHHQVTTEKCMAYCSSKNMKYGGTEFGAECFCGNSLHNSQKIDESRCTMSCIGDDKQKCGGSLALSVYGKKSSKRSVHQHAAAHKRGGFGNWA